MKNVVVKSSVLLIGLLLLLISCHNSTSNSKIIYSDVFYYLDVVGDNSLDTIIVSNNETNKSIRDIFLIKGGKKNRIISIGPWRDSVSVVTQPPIETIYLEVNNVQSFDKGLRIVIRNTDVIPDYLFIDLYYEDTWIVEKYVLVNTNTMYGKREMSIEYVNIDKPVSIEFGEDLMCNTNLDIDYRYFVDWRR